MTVGRKSLEHLPCAPDRDRPGGELVILQSQDAIFVQVRWDRALVKHLTAAILLNNYWSKVSLVINTYIRICFVVKFPLQHRCTKERLNI